MHFGQEVRSGHFRQFDHGYVENMIKYKQLTPPDYDISNIKTPIALYYAHNDWLAVPKDVVKLIKLLPNVINDYPISHEKFNHVDFLYGIDAEHLVYDEILRTMEPNNQLKHNSVDINVNNVDV